MLRAVVVAGFALLSLPGFALARPADCSLVAEGKTLIDGRCEFTSEADGSFIVTAGAISANVMVDPGAREGRAFYEDKSPRTGGSFVIGDVRRDGACWANKVGRVCAWAVGARPAPAGGAPSAPPPPRAWGKSGAWTIVAVDNARGLARGFSLCRAARTVPNGEVRIGLNTALDMTMSTALGVSTPPRFDVTLTAGREKETVQASVNAEGRMALTLPPPLAREMVEQGPKELLVENPAGAIAYPIENFRAVWDELNKCVEASGNR